MVTQFSDRCGHSPARAVLQREQVIFCLTQLVSEVVHFHLGAKLSNNLWACSAVYTGA